MPGYVHVNSHADRRADADGNRYGGTRGPPAKCHDAAAHVHAATIGYGPASDGDALQGVAHLHSYAAAPYADSRTGAYGGDRA